MERWVAMSKIRKTQAMALVTGAVLSYIATSLALNYTSLSDAYGHAWMLESAVSISTNSPKKDNITKVVMFSCLERIRQDRRMLFGYIVSEYIENCKQGKERKLKEIRENPVYLGY